MKALFISLTLLVFGFFLGCQSSITDPEGFESTKFIGSPDEETSTYGLNKDVFHFTYPNVIKLSGTLYDPSHKLNSLVEISGLVRYGIREVEQDIWNVHNLSTYKTSPAGTSPDKTLKVDLFVDALFKVNCPHCNRPWTVKKPSVQIVKVNAANQSVVYFTKIFRIQNTCCDPLNLVLKFEFQEDRLALVSMALELAISNVVNNTTE